MFNSSISSFKIHRHGGLIADLTTNYSAYLIRIITCTLVQNSLASRMANVAWWTAWLCGLKSGSSKCTASQSARKVHSLHCSKNPAIGQPECISLQMKLSRHLTLLNKCSSWWELTLYHHREQITIEDSLHTTNPGSTWKEHGFKMTTGSSIAFHHCGNCKRLADKIKSKT